MKLIKIEDETYINPDRVVMVKHNSPITCKIIMSDQSIITTRKTNMSDVVAIINGTNAEFLVE